MMPTTKLGIFHTRMNKCIKIIYFNVVDFFKYKRQSKKIIESSE